MSDAAVMEQFRAALSAHGIVPPPRLLTDGQLHRCDCDGKPGKKDAAYVLHLDGLPAGGFENHRDGQGWQSWHADTGHSLTETQQREYRAKVDAMQKQRLAEQQAKERAAQTTAMTLWEKAKHDCTKHPYLTAKRIAAHGIRMLNIIDARAIAHNLPGGLNGDVLMIPVRGGTESLRGLQLIDATGTKRFLSGTGKHGGYFAIGEGKPESVLCIAEGFATAASIHEATGYPVAAAFDAGNLPHAAHALREKFPDTLMVICADDDHTQQTIPA